MRVNTDGSTAVPGRHTDPEFRTVAHNDGISFLLPRHVASHVNHAVIPEFVWIYKTDAADHIVGPVRPATINGDFVLSLSHGGIGRLPDYFFWPVYWE